MNPAQHSPKAKVDIAAVREKLAALVASGQTDALLEVVISLILQLQQDNERLGERVHSLLRRIYGRKTEKVSAEQLSLLFEALDGTAPQGAEDIAKQANAAVPQPPEKPRRLREHHGRSALPANLPRQTVIITVPEAERACPECGAERKGMGYIKSEILEFVPAHFVVIEEQREKLACEVCEANVTVAESEKVMDRGRPGPGLIANILVEKHDDSMPLERQSKQYARSGVRLSPSTIGDWYTFGAEVIKPIAALIVARVLGSFVINADDTGHRVLDPHRKEHIKRARLWCFVGDGKYVAFHYAPDWKAEHPGEFLRDFEGFVQADAYGGYSSEVGPPEDRHIVIRDEMRLGCGMHIRRKFEQTSEAGDPQGAIGVAYFRRLYDLERLYKQQELTPEQRGERRRELSVPVVQELKTWVDSKRDTTIPGTLLYKAIGYATRQWTYFERCFTDGRFEIDNGAVEREFRRIRLGEKNYLFAGSDAGAKRIADVCTVIATCKAHGIEPWAYLRDVISKLQRGWPMARIDELLPDAWHPQLV